MNLEGFISHNSKVAIFDGSAFFLLAPLKKRFKDLNQKKSSASLNFLIVPTTGFEPAHLLAPPPQDGVSTNFTTWAYDYKYNSIQLNQLEMKLYLFVPRKLKILYLRVCGLLFF